MEKDRIQVFNKALDKHLNDMAYFEDLITNHYLEFAFGYNIISAENVMELIDDVECVLGKPMTFVIVTKEELSQDLIKLLKVQSTSCWDHVTYSAEFNQEGCKVSILISER